jgi:signal transduction histidine kinase
VQTVTDRALITLGRAIAIATMLLGVLTVIVWTMSGAWSASLAESFMELSGTVIAPVVVLIVLPHVPRNGSVWAFGIVGFALGLAVLGDAVAWAVSGVTAENVNDLLVSAAPADLPMSAAVGLTVAMTMWIPSFVLLPTQVLLLFPDGQYPSPQRRWRWIGILAISTAIIGALALAWQFRPWGTVGYADIVQDYSSFAGWIAGLGGLSFILLAVAAIVGYVIKWKRSKGDERLQYRLVGFVFLVFAINSVVTVVVPPYGASGFQTVVAWAMIVLIPITYGVAILKYRLYDINVVISRTVTFGVLAAFITGVYALVVVGIGSWVGDGSNLALSIVAVAIVAVAFEPLRRRVQHWANVLVYGKRATPYEVLANATARLSDTRDPDAALAQITQLLVDGTGASEAVFWLSVGDVMQPTISTPPSAVDELSSIIASSDSVGGLPGDSVVAVRHRGEVLGALGVTKDPGDAVTDADEKVLDDVAAGAGALLRNIGLHAELADRAEQLRASRRRLVAAQDAERHRLERDLHDGAQQQVVALKVKLGIARTLAEREGADSLAELVASLAVTTQEAVDGLRMVAHGIYPPLLEAEGLEVALRAAKRTISVPVEIVATGVERYERRVEESLYFAVLGMIAQAIDGGASRAVVSVTGADQLIRFSVHVDAPSSDLVSVEDRIDALDGTLTISSDLDAFVITGELPAETLTLERA